MIEKKKYGICDVLMRLSENDFVIVSCMFALIVLMLSCLALGVLLGVAKS